MACVLKAHCAEWKIRLGLDLKDLFVQINAESKQGESNSDPTPTTPRLLHLLLAFHLGTLICDIKKIDRFSFLNYFRSQTGQPVAYFYGLKIGSFWTMHHMFCFVSEMQTRCHSLDEGNLSN